MNVKSVLFLLGLWIVSFNALAQDYDLVINDSDIKNVEQEGNRLKIVFYLYDEQGYEYNISALEVSTAGNNILTEAISGDTESIGSGEHTIYWDVFQDVDILERIDALSIKLNYTLASDKMAAQQRSAERSQRDSWYEQEDKVDDYSITDKEIDKEEEKDDKGYGFFRWGVKGGIGATFPTINHSSNKFGSTFSLTTTPVMDWSLGGIARIHLGRLGLTAEMNYGQFAFDLESSGEYRVEKQDVTTQHTMGYVKTLKGAYTKFPIYASWHLSDGFAVLVGKSRIDFRSFEVSGKHVESFSNTDKQGNYVHGGTNTNWNHYDMTGNDFEVTSLDDVDLRPIRQELDGYIIGCEFESRSTSISFYYEFYTDNVIDETYFSEVGTSVGGGTYDLENDVLPQMNTMEMYIHQFSVQLTYWF